VDEKAILLAFLSRSGYYNSVFTRFLMAKVSENIGKREGLPTDSAVSAYVGSLDNEHRMLVVLKSQLYSGKWEPMVDDLENRLSGKPYIFKVSNRIKDDVERINEMRDFEKAHQVDLADFVEL
jgi:hypothetical protein